ncbi:MAG: nucleoside recognition domain-containing protein [Casimicrobiaceae bacterium]
MALTYLWSGFFLVGIAAAVLQWLATGDGAVFKKIIDGTFAAARLAVMDISLPLAGVMTFWLGMLSVGEKAGVIAVVSRWIAPLFSRLFPSVPRDHPAHGHMIMNYSANFLGLDNAATPLGLKAMKSLQELNPQKDTASDAQLMFLVIQTSGLTLIPLSVIAQRAVLGAANPTDIFIPTLIATYCATLVAILLCGWKQKIRLADPVIIGWLGGITAGLAGLVWALTTQLTREQIETVSLVVSNLILAGIIAVFLAFGLARRINVYEAFIEGAKEGVQTALTILPYLVAMLVAISVLRNSGVLDLAVAGFAWFFGWLGLATDWVAALPTALMKPISGSGARAMFIDAMKTYGVDSFVGRLASVLQGATDTTLYIIALYFGTVGVTKVRYGLAFGLLADLAGIVAAIFVAYLFFG